MANRLWIDEGISFLGFGFMPIKRLLFDYIEPNQHTFFLILARFSMDVFGVHEISYRLPSLIAGAICVPVLYKLCILVNNSRSIGLISAILLTFSIPHLHYSQLARGYSLSVLLGLLVFYSGVKIIKNGPSWLCAGVLVLSGFCMVLTIPSNVHFVLATSFSLVIMAWGRVKKTREKERIKNIMTPLVVLWGLIISYLGVIFQDLKLGIQIYQNFARNHLNIQNLNVSIEKLGEVLTFLADPWGLGLFLVFLLGLPSLKRSNLLFPFLAIFIIPVLLNLITQVMGPPRTYLYWIPFILMVVAMGLVEAGEIVKSKLHYKFGSLVVVILCALLVYFSEIRQNKD